MSNRKGRESCRSQKLTDSPSEPLHESVSCNKSTPNKQGNRKTGERKEKGVI